MVQMKPGNQTKQGMAVDCAKWDSSVPMTELEKEEAMDPEVEKWMQAKLRDKCRDESGGVEEQLECLEREVIMGEDEGKEPLDYNRRAHIFDKSSSVFQALKERSNPPLPPQQS
ncbi:hypothetical protein HS088_TW01G00550 [Tripterygium wilfordii]|uniref:Uncharacterized protein n=2 Tax=Tripterygium wilfordii TaxID=458696 RepID=A0A7J7E211_TRIWF|nr:hypothetical protein HS088_TW01G00550 [Tripterygium wilfordii]